MYENFLWKSKLHTYCVFIQQVHLWVRWHRKAVKHDFHLCLWLYTTKQYDLLSNSTIVMLSLPVLMRHGEKEKHYTTQLQGLRWKDNTSEQSSNQFWSSYFALLYSVIAKNMWIFNCSGSECSKIVIPHWMSLIDRILRQFGCWVFHCIAKTYMEKANISEKTTRSESLKLIIETVQILIMINFDSVGHDMCFPYIFNQGFNLMLLFVGFLQQTSGTVSKKS